MKKAITVGLVFALALAALAGCGVNQEEESHRSGGEGYTGGPAWGKPAQKVVVNFEGIVSSVEDGTITDDTAFGGDPDTGNTVSEDIQPGNFIQGYTEDQPGAGPLTAENIWANLPQSGGE